MALLGANNGDVFERVSGEKVMGPVQETLLNLRINNDLINHLPDMDTLLEVVRFLKALLDNDFDKNVFVVSNAPTTVIKVLSRLLEIRASDYQQSSFLSTILRETLTLTQRMLRDPLLQRDIAKHNFLTPLCRFPARFAALEESSLSSAAEDIDADELALQVDPTDYLVGDSQSLTRCFEALYSLLEFACTQQVKFA
jgi:hypothetical protein